MKITMISFSLFSLSKMEMNLILLTLLILLMPFKIINKTIISNQLYMTDQLSMIMIFLTLISTILIFISSEMINKIIITMNPILIFLIITFSMHYMFNFYIMFELILIPTMIMITSLGKQPERLQAGIYLLMYTILASLPLMIMILLLKNNTSFTLASINMYKIKFMIFVTLAFLIKMPMFFMHLWLPKAHVEAPLEGSMILAAILLKLGGYGLIRMFPLCLNKILSINFWLISITLMGSTMTSLNCMRQKDLKSLIAYSSVAHMGLVLASISTFNFIGLSAAILMMVAHGLSSSALFLLVNDLYMKFHSRNTILFKGLISIMPNMILWWFMFMAINISAPPSINTISEIMIMTSLIMWSKLLIIMITMASFSTASFSLLMFINISHNKNLTLPFNPSKQKIFLSLFIHLIPLIMLLMKMEMIIIYNN